MDSYWRSSRTFSMPLASPPVIAYLGEGTFGANFSDRILRYTMGDVWCAHFYTYEGELIVNGEAFPIRPRYVSVTPPLAKQEWRLKGISTHRAVIFSLPVAGDRFGEEVLVPAMSDLGDGFETAYADIQEATSFFKLHRRRAEARVWDVLWRLIKPEAFPVAGTRHDERILQLCKIVEKRLSCLPAITALAEEVGLGVNQVERLFRRDIGMTVVRYIRRRRAERARDLLLKTSMPIKLVACEVGISDLQRFYKTIHLEFGITPGEIRRKGMPSDIVRVDFHVNAPLSKPARS